MSSGLFVQARWAGTGAGWSLRYLLSAAAAAAAAEEEEGLGPEPEGVERWRKAELGAMPCPWGVSGEFWPIVEGPPIWMVPKVGDDALGGP